jgi:hypothetical protein
MKLHLAGVFFLAIAACESPVATSRDLTLEELSDLTLRTDSTTYTATLIGGEGSYRTYGVTLVARFTNGTSRPVYLDRCYPGTPYPIYGIVSSEPSLESAYNPVWACVGHDQPIVVRAGETRTDFLQIAGPNMWDGHTKEPMGALVGRYRLTYSVNSCADGYPCDVSARIRGSNEFEIRLAP